MPGKAIAHYQILAKLGEGGMGEVWRAHDTHLDRDVALKVLPADRFSDESARARLVREARIASRLNHPHICTIHEVGECEGQAYIAMELVKGRTLSARLAEGALPSEEMLRIGQQIADAVGHAHEQGVVHRDLKSANVMLTPEGRAKVLDFGLAKRLRSEEAQDAPTQTIGALTGPGMVVGTLAYMAPEQLRGEPANSRSDVWALGVVLYEMAAGRRPFQGHSNFDLSSAILKEAPAALPRTVPRDLAAVITRCLAKEPARRYHHAGEVRAALDAVGSGRLAPWVGWRYELSRRRWLVWIGVLTLVLAALAFSLRGWLWGPQRAVRLAVLPFTNLSGDAEQEYLSDGMTQEVISQLGSLHPASLSVIARTSVMRYKKSDKPVDEIGRELNVDHILEGSARREGGRIRITAELIQVRGQTQLWAETYEREMAGVLALQSAVAKKVAGSLALKLLPAEQARLAKARQVNPEAYEAYLKGLQQWHTLTRAGVDAALLYFESALQKDPSYAPAYAGVSLVWVGRAQTGLVPRAEALPRLKAAALKAVELDDTIAETHYALALVKANYEWDRKGAEQEFKRAIELNPSFPDARVSYSLSLTQQRPKEALEEMARARALDPLNPLFQSLHAQQLVSLRRYEEGITLARKALQAVPGHPIALGALRRAFGMKGMEQEEVAAWKADRSFRGDHEAIAVFDQGYREGGYRAGWRRYAEYRAAGFRKTHTGAWAIAQAYIRAGENSLALDWLEKGFEVQDPNLGSAFGNPIFDPVQSDLRFQALRRKMNIPE